MAPPAMGMAPKKKITLAVYVGLLAASLQVLALSLPTAKAFMPPHTNMLAVHLVLELFAVVIAFQIVAVAWHTLRPSSKGSANLLITGFLVIGTCDLVHALTYDGMPDFLGPSDTERGIFFWLAGRTVELIVITGFAFNWRLQLSRALAVLLGAAIASVLIWLGSFQLALFPTTFIEGQGVTPFKASYEIALCTLHALISISLLRAAYRTSKVGYALIGLSAWLMAVGGLSFTSYVSPSDFNNIFGHGYKIAAYAILYWVAVSQVIKAPMNALVVSEKNAIENEAKLRSLSNNLPNSAIYQLVRDEHGRSEFLYVSENIEKLTGIPQEEILSNPQLLYDAVHKDDLSLLIDQEADSLKRLDIFDAKVRFHHRNGQLRWVHISSAPRKLKSGQVCWDGLHTDVTEQHLSEVQKQETAALLAAVVDSANDAIITTHLDGEISYANPAAESIFGYPASSLINHSLRMLIPGVAEHENFKTWYDTGAETHPELRLKRFRADGQRRDGRAIELEIAVSEVLVDGRTLLTAVLRDITERGASERAMHEYQRDLHALTRQLMAKERETTRKLAQSLHDQLGQTLTSIRLDFVTEAKLTEEAQAVRHARVDKLIDRAVSEVRQVLVELRPTVLDERGLAEALENELSANWKHSATKLNIWLDIEPSLLGQRWASEVEYAFFMVAREAVMNIVKHAEATTVQILLRGSERNLHLEVTDDGKGVFPGQLSPRPGHLGLIGMTERAIAINAQFSVISPLDGGTVVSIHWKDPTA